MSDDKHGDAEFAAPALDRLACSVSGPRDAVKAAVANGRVTLTGTVEYRDEHALAGTTAWAAPTGTAHPAGRFYLAIGKVNR